MIQYTDKPCTADALLSADDFACLQLARMRISLKGDRHDQ